MTLSRPIDLAADLDLTLIRIFLQKPLPTLTNLLKPLNKAQLSLAVRSNLDYTHKDLMQFRYRFSDRLVTGILDSGKGEWYAKIHQYVSPNAYHPVDNWPGTIRNQVLDPVFLLFLDGLIDPGRFASEVFSSPREWDERCPGEGGLLFSCA